jgi:hypothetical protein
MFELLPRLPQERVHLGAFGARHPVVKSVHISCPSAVMGRPVPENPPRYPDLCLGCSLAHAYAVLRLASAWGFVVP